MIWGWVSFARCQMHKTLCSTPPAPNVKQQTPTVVSECGVVCARNVLRPRLRPSSILSGDLLLWGVQLRGCMIDNCRKVKDVNWWLHIDLNTHVKSSRQDINSNFAYYCTHCCGRYYAHCSALSLCRAIVYHISAVSSSIRVECCLARKILV